MYGLKPHTIQAIQNVFAKYPNIEKAILYGSRAKGNYRNGSDIDLTLVGKDLTLSEQFGIETELDDLLLPYKIDLSIYHKIENQDLIDHIDRVGIVFYKYDELLDWEEKELKDVAKLVKESWKVGDEELPYIALEHIVENGLKIDSIGSSNEVASNKYYFNENTFLFGKLRPYFRKLYRPNFRGICSTDIWVVEPKEENDKDFLFYFFANKEFVDISYASSSGTRMPRADWNYMGNTLWDFPKYKEQQAIAEVLSSLDAKIDLLHRQNQTLEALAETLFRQWFVDKEFDSTVEDLVNVQNGYAFKSKDFKDFGVNKVIKIKNISGNKVDISAADFISEEVASKTNEKFKISTGDILFAMTGAEIGKMGIVETNTQNLWLNQRVGLLNEKYKGAKYLAYLCLQSDFGQDYIEHAATGSAQPNISATGIEACPFPKLTKNQIIEYSNSISPFYDKVIFNLGEIKTLEKTRDTLLPKLMSGEVRVNAL